MDILQSLINYLIPIVIAALTFERVEWLKDVNEWLDARGPAFKQIFVGVFSFCLALVASKLMVTLSGDAMTDAGMILSAVLPYIFHLGKKKVS